MVILTDCLTEKIDEGCLKVANTLAQKIKKTVPETQLLSYGRQSKNADIFLKLNKLFLNPSLFKKIRNCSGNLLYIPFASNTTASILRSCILSFFCKKEIYSLFALRHPMNKIGEFFLGVGKFNVIALSKKSFNFYHERIGERVLYLKTGVDLQKFCQIDEDKKSELKREYGISENKPIVLHVGHLHNGRNVGTLADINEDKEIIMVVSSVSKQDDELRRKIEAKKNIRIIDVFVPRIQELYQLADVYVFPVVKEENSIDIPLSVLEAAGCGLSVVTTKYGELNEFVGREGFYFLEEVEKVQLNKAIDSAINERKSARNSVLNYDWEFSISLILEKLRR